MAEKKLKVTFEPEGKTVYAAEGTTIFEAAGEAGIIFKSDCGGMGVCGNCKVKVIQGDYQQKGSEKFIPPEKIKKGLVLACRTSIKSSMVVEVPVESRLYEQKILTTGAERQLKLSPNVRKVFLKVPVPSLEDQRSDLDRIWEALEDVSHRPRIPVDILRRLPHKLRKVDFSATVVLNEDEIVGIEAGDKSGLNYGIALDIGTTTVVGYLMDLNTGKQLAVASRTNPQTSYGDDVISRIHYTNTHKDGLEDLQERIISCINDIISELASTAGVEKKFIYEITATGNTTMNHLFLGITPKYLALYPYVSVMRTNIDTRAPELGIHINRYGKVYSMPNIAGFVGGDTVAVILSSDMHKSDKLRFAIDIGTNGELVMGNKHGLVACSTAAGPAFEGARITFGMRGSDGAIEKVAVNKQGVEINTIGNAKPVGICGTALIDCVAEMLKAGIINNRGKLLDKNELPSELPDFIKQRVIKHPQYGPGFILVPGSESKTGEDII
ncbi:MAG: ASKHA domain-containing protein, partial [Spirochaetota bacterium]